MRRIDLRDGLTVFMMLLLGCSGGSNSPVATIVNTPITTPVTTTNARAKFAYTGNQGGSISGYSVDGTTGALSALSGFPMQTGLNPITVTHDPQDRFLIVGDVASSQLTAFSINSSTGALTKTSTATISTGNSVFEAIDAVVDPSGTHVYVASQGSNTVGAFNLSATGVLTPVIGQPFATGGTQSFGDALVVNASGTALYVQDETGVYVFSIASGSGVLTLAQTISVSVTGLGGGLALDPSGNYLYVAEPTNQVVAAYSVDGSTGKLNFAKNATNVGATAVAISPTGQFAYVIASYQQIRSYTVSNGSFTLTGSLSGIWGQRLTVDPSGRFVYVPQSCSQNCPGGIYNVVNEYAIGNSGVLTPIVGGPAASGTTPWGITITAQ